MLYSARPDELESEELTSVTRVRTRSGGLHSSPSAARPASRHLLPPGVPRVAAAVATAASGAGTGPRAGDRASSEVSLPKMAGPLSAWVDRYPGRTSDTADAHVNSPRPYTLGLLHSTSFKKVQMFTCKWQL